MELLRVLTTAKLTLSQTFTVDEVATDAAGSVNVTVKRLDGTVVAGPTAATHPGPVGLYTYDLPAQPAVDALRVEWTGSVGGAC